MNRVARIGLVMAIAVAAPLVEGACRTDRPDPETLVPLPERPNFIAPDAATPPPGVGFHGAWAGAWSDDLRHILLVEDVRPDGSATVVHAIADSARWAVRGAWNRGPATIENGTLRLSRGGGSISYRLDGEDRLTGRYETPAGQLTMGVLARTDPATLRAPHLVDTWPLPGERVRMPHPAIPPAGDGAATLEARLYRPRAAEPAPLAVFSHGSDIGRDLLRSYGHFEDADWLLRQGYAVLVPMRRGRGWSDGVYREDTYRLDDAGNITGIDQGVDEAVEDLDATLAFGATLPFVRPGPVLLVGQSRGGFLSVIYAARRPGRVAAVINFSGGWLGGSRSNLAHNTTYFGSAGGSVVSQLWLYAERDSFFDMAHVRANHAAFQAAGGNAILHVYPAIQGDGHRLRQFRRVWQADAERFLAGLR